MSILRWMIVPMCLLAMNIGNSADAPEPSVDPQAVRQAIIAVTDTWSRARVAYDHAAFERILAPDFHVSLAEKPVGRADFVAHISTPSSPGRLIRFDSRVMTLTHQPDRNEWIAVVISKMEWEEARKGASPKRVYGLWTTREGFRRVASTGWQVTFTEEIGSEYWGGDQRPPFSDW